MQFESPQVGKTVRVTTRYPEIYYHARSPWQDHTYEGTVMAPDRSVPQGSFFLHTPQTPEYPLRAIALARVIAMEYADGSPVPTQATKDQAQVWQVQGSRGAVYTVTQRGADKTCTCPGFTFRRACKHVVNG